MILDDSFLEELKKQRKWNTGVTIIGIFLIFAIYGLSASMASTSDNIGILLVPIIVPIFHSPLISFLYAVYSVNKLINKRGVRSLVDYKDIPKLALNGMPALFYGIGCLILAGFVLISLFILLSILTFPFWPIFLG